jgi:hypothetical protein
MVTVERSRGMARRKIATIMRWPSNFRADHDRQFMIGGWLARVVRVTGA